MILKNIKKGEQFTFEGDTEVWEVIDGTKEMQKRLKRQQRKLCIQSNMGLTGKCVAYPYECIVNKVGVKK